MSLHCPLKTFHGQLAAVLRRHHPLDALDDRRRRAAVVLELLGAVVDFDPRTLADVLVVGALVGVLEPAPAAYVVDQDGRIVGMPRLHVLDHRPQRVSSLDLQPALAVVGISADDFVAAFGRPLADHVGLVLRGILLVLGGHADVLGRTDELGGRFGDFGILVGVLHLGIPLRCLIFLRAVIRRGGCFRATEVALSIFWTWPCGKSRANLWHFGGKPIARRA